MSKYLIQDIIPPEKKHRGAPRIGAKKSNGEKQVISHLPVEAGHEHPIHKITPAMKIPISEAFPENPRRMIINQIEQGEVEDKVTEKKYDDVTEAHYRSAKMIRPDQKVWSYDLHTDEDGVTSPLSPSSSPPLPEKTYNMPMNDDADGSKVGTWIPWLVGVAVVVVAGVLLMNYFASATVTIVSKHETLPLDEKIGAWKNGGANDLPYAIMSATTSLSLEVPATGEKTVTTKASGRIVVYNEQTTTQRLIKNTRFQAPNGKIYRISDSITVPKANTAGGKTTPGSLEVTVYADEAGPAYNSDPVDFTLPGLKSSPLFKKVYARSKGPLVGGALGTIKTVSDQDLKAAGEDLRVKLETKLRSTARGSLAPVQIAYDQGIVVELGQPSLSKAAASASNKAVVTEEGKIFVVLFKRADITKAILKKIVENYAGEKVDIKNLESLQFTMSPQNGDALVGGAKLDFSLKGNPELSWVVDNVAVKKAILGISKESFNSILGQFPAVERAQASVRPMWKGSFPDDPNRISVVLVDKLP